MTHPTRRLSIAFLLLPLAACAASETDGAVQAPESSAIVRYARSTPPPMHLSGTAHDAAKEVELLPRTPEELPGLHNVFRLSDTILSGSEPHGPEGLAAIRDLGVRTILSVDGKEPDAEAAAALGLRYVHIPIQYSGFSDGELAEITKTFRELEGPFYVHCFHGKHRGPAAAAVGRVVLDGASRETAIGEMKHYCGTSEKYEGLYREIAITPFPTIAESSAYSFDFPAVHRPEGMVGAMVRMARAHDHLVELEKRQWALDPEHPDVDALNKAVQIRQAFESAQDLTQVVSGPEDLRTWMAQSLADSRTFVEAIEAARAGSAEAGSQASAAFKRIRAGCNECHAAYRD
jgi:protein tyrosine phosphatase (PTP) superfamily phosphohydrolase (DUF442 family)/cytochrome c556